MRVTSRLWPRGDDGGGDARNLGGRLPLPKHHFREALPGRAMMVDLGKAQIFARSPARSGSAPLGVAGSRRPSRTASNSARSGVSASADSAAVVSRNLRECARRWAFALVTAARLTPSGTPSVEWRVASSRDASHSMTAPETFVLVAYFFVLSILGIYGWHRYFLVYQYKKYKDAVPARRRRSPSGPSSPSSCRSTTRCTSSIG